MTTHVPQKVPEHFSRVDIGAYMRELRLHYGLSEQDVSERLHIRMRYVTAIEAANFDAMPGKAYARGYVHTYAEFLGLDADQVVERCFGGEMAHAAQAHSIPDSSDWYKRSKRYGGVLAVLLLLGGLFYIATQSDEGADTETAAETSTIETVPEEYLASMRRRLMPTAGNYNCIGEESQLGCYRSQRLTREWTVPAPLPAMSPAPASAFEELVDNDEIDATDDADAADDAADAPAPVKKEEPKPAAKPAAKKPEPKKEAPAKAKESENKKFPGMPANYKGYYVPPKPKPAAEDAPAAKSEPKAEEPNRPAEPAEEPATGDNN